ncbi:TetR/AcrR family transcriptional regulator C-terminal domain-containing protein [Nocardiopsis composta]|uniref:AcrR family transcriptional regulator n=1 Tax=Nocardiopsis composta TaxID=157465 RepID=A0A7W8QHF6_9ACTN|nr:TetR/AcrR family transcriptional regulator C-terminal domain-containing protein [Nocardiopsis composta]MBB5430528.1 AcrR family transcriptional regulator [Nocardiopsis composta]
MTIRNGGGDPARTLALLWRTAGPVRKGRTGLDVDRVVAAAIGIADAEGLDALSMRKVADRLGVGAMSLYTYVPGKAELAEAMLDAVRAELPDPAEAGEGWRARLEAVARQNRDLYLRHPWMLQVAAGRPVLGPNSMVRYDRELRALEGLGLSDIEMDGVIALLSDYVHGAAREAVAMADAAADSGRTDQEWWEQHAPELERIADPSVYPVAARVGTAVGERYGASHDPAADFDFGLKLVLDGVAALLESRARP